MKKLLVTLLSVILLVGCNNAGVEKENPTNDLVTYKCVASKTDERNERSYEFVFENNLISEINYYIEGESEEFVKEYVTIVYKEKE